LKISNNISEPNISSINYSKIENVKIVSASENKLGVKPNSTKNRISTLKSPNIFKSLSINSIPEEIQINEKNFVRFNSENDVNNVKDELEINSNRNSIHIEKNVSNFIQQKNEDLLKQTIKSSFTPIPINTLGITKEEYF